MLNQKMPFTPSLLYWLRFNGSGLREFRIVSLIIGIMWADGGPVNYRMAVDVLERVFLQPVQGEVAVVYIAFQKAAPLQSDALQIVGEILLHVVGQSSAFVIQ